MALLRAILLTLNQSATPTEASISSALEGPRNETITASALMYSSLLISLLAAFIAMLGKQWLNRYLQNTGGSMVERCRDRQRKCDGLEKWPFHLFIESLPIMLQISLLLLSCGLCRHMWSICPPIAYTLITLTVLGILFYLTIVIAGASSYECPFQTPASTTLRDTWKKIQPHAALLSGPIITICARVPQALSLNILLPLWNGVVCPTVFSVLRFERAVVQMAQNFYRHVCAVFRSRWHFSPPSPPLEEIRENSRMSPGSIHSTHKNDSSSHGTPSPMHDTGSSYRNAELLPLATNPSFQDTPGPTQGNIEPWVTQEDMTIIQKTNSRDVRCVSWILRDITDPEALDAAIRFAGTIRWFEDGIDVKPPYDVIVSASRTCPDFTGTVYPGLSDRAYYSARAILWIHIRAMCVSEEFARNFPLPSTTIN